MKNLILSVSVFALMFTVVFFLISFAWIGAEYIIEHNVNFGMIDRVVAVILTVRVLNGITVQERKRNKREEGKDSYKEIARNNAN